jgi:membrane fusion protein, copper/silver efflux system
MRTLSRSPVIVCALVLVALSAVTAVVSCNKKTGSHGADERTTIYHCPMHPQYLSQQQGDCPICGMKLVPAYESDDKGNGVKIDPAMIQSIGVQTEKAAVRTLTREVRSSATVVPDERRISLITTKVMGYVEKLYVDYTGQPVIKGQPLYDVYSPDLVSAQSEYLQIFRNSAQQDSGQILQSIRRRLLNWDITESQIADLEKRGAPEKTMTIVSQASGIVTEKMVVKGQSIEPGMQLYKVIDYSRVWVEGSIYQQDVALVSVGQRGGFELDYYPGEQFSGKVTYIAPELNMESRTLKVRLELANTSDMRIKPGMNASLTIHAAVKKQSVTVPDQAIIHSGLRTLVVVAKGGGYFEPREVKTGRTAGGYAEVLSGVTEGEDIVVSSQFLIDSESNLRAAVMKMTRGKNPKDQPTSSDTLPGKAAEVQQAGDVQATPQVNHSPVLKAEKVPAAQGAHVYTCPMDPEVIDEKPGKCPKCGMNLVLKKN